MLCKRHVQGTFFDSNCVEMGVETIEMHEEDSKLQKNTRLVSIEKSRHELLTSRKANVDVYVIWTPCSRDIFR